MTYTRELTPIEFSAQEFEDKRFYVRLGSLPSIIQRTWHYGSKQGDIETSNYTLSHKLGSEQKERVSEQTNERSGAREQREQTEQANK